MSAIFFTATLIMALLVSPIDGSTQDNSASQSSPNSDFSIKSFEIGFENQIVLGHWVPFRLNFETPLPQAAHWISVATLDGSGVQQRYIYKLTDASKTTCYVRFGRSKHNVVVSLLNNKQETLSSQTISGTTISESHTFHPSVRPVFLNIGSDLELKRHLGLERVQTKRSEDADSVYIGDASKLPDRAIGYDSVDSIVLTTRDKSFVENLSDTQIDAMLEWVESGGRLVLSCGENANEYLAIQKKLARLSISDVTGITEIQNTGRIESYVDSQNPLVQRNAEPLAAAKNSGDENVVIFLADRNGPLLARKAIGFGEITFVAIDLDDPRVHEWSDFPRLLSKAMDYEINLESSGSGENRSGRVTHVGFEDIYGQLRSALDQFKNVQLINFTLIVVLTGLFILLIGPADYFFLSRLLKKMELTWITFPLLIAAFCGLAYLIHAMTKSSVHQINQVEVVDLDESSNQIRGFVWSHLYSPSSSTHDIKLIVDQPGVKKIDNNWLSWQGLPGTGLGGMQTDATWRGSEYSSIVDEQKNHMVSSLSAFPVQTSSTSSFAGRWNGSSSLDPDSRLFQNQSGTDLTGTFTNPFDVPLSNAVILHRETAYVFRRSIKAGDTVSVETATTRQRIRSYFSNTRGGDVNAEKRRWDVLSHNIPRIMEMMMFYDVAAGHSTRLSNEFAERLDTSKLLNLNRVILVGRVKKALNTIEMDGKSTDEFRDQQWTFVRIIMPVENE